MIKIKYSFKWNKCIDREIIIRIKTILFELDILSDYRFFYFDLE